MKGRSCRLLFLQFFRPPAPEPALSRFDPVLGVLSAVLRERGHEISLLTFDHFDPRVLHERITAFRPDLLYADVALTCPDLARRVLSHVEQKHGLLTVVGGAYSAVDPESALSFPGVSAVVTGEPECALPGYLDAYLSGDPEAPVPGVWSRDECGTARSGPCPLSRDLDALPFADRGLFANGRGPDEVTALSVGVGRGCPLRCAYCPNERIAEAYGGPDGYVRRRSPEDICDEIDGLCLAHPQVGLIRFEDHLFALDEEWLARFSAVYAGRCGVPFECHVRAQAVGDRTANLLAAAGCVLAEIHVVSGSALIRNDILAMEVSDAQLVAAFERLGQRGIRTRAVSLVGAPYATVESMEKLDQLIHRIGPDEHDVRVFHPLPGTAARDLCREAGWLSNRGEENYTLGESILDMPNLRADVIQRLAHQLRTNSRPRTRSGLLGALERMRVLPGRGLRQALAALAGRSTPR